MRFRARLQQTISRLDSCKMHDEKTVLVAEWVVLLSSLGGSEIRPEKQAAHLLPISASYPSPRNMVAERSTPVGVELAYNLRYLESCQYIEMYSQSLNFH